MLRWCLCWMAAAPRDPRGVPLVLQRGHCMESHEMGYTGQFHLSQLFPGDAAQTNPVNCCLYLGRGMVDSWSLAFWSAFSSILEWLLLDSGALSSGVKNAVAFKFCEGLLLQKKSRF